MESLIVFVVLMIVSAVLSRLGKKKQEEEAEAQEAEHSRAHPDPAQPRPRPAAAQPGNRQIPPTPSVWDREPDTQPDGVSTPVEDSDDKQDKRSLWGDLKWELQEAARKAREAEEEEQREHAEWLKESGLVPPVPTKVEEPVAPPIPTPKPKPVKETAKREDKNVVGLTKISRRKAARKGVIWAEVLGPCRAVNSYRPPEVAGGEE